MEKITIPIDVDADDLEKLAERYPLTAPAAFIGTLIELEMVRRGSPPPARFGVGSAEFIRCAKIALSDGVPVERVILVRKGRIAREVAGAFRTGAR